MTTASQQAGECARCLQPLAEHEVVTDSWGDVVRICPEEDVWDADRERAYFRRRQGYLS